MGSLEKHLQKCVKEEKYIDNTQVLRWIDELAKATLFLHETCRIIHNDIAARNLVISSRVERSLGQELYSVYPP